MALATTSPHAFGHSRKAAIIETEDIHQRAGLTIRPLMQDETGLPDSATHAALLEIGVTETAQRPLIIGPTRLNLYPEPQHHFRVEKRLHVLARVDDSFLQKRWNVCNVTSVH